MALPESIRLHPLKAPIRTTLGVPGSKSITNRALILAALSKGCTTLRGALWSEDTQVMVDCLQRLGIQIEVRPDQSDPANRSIKVQGSGGSIPNAGTESEPLELFVGNAGTAARFLLALVCLGNGLYRLSGVQRMHQRPQEELVNSLRELGYVVETTNGRLPAIVHGQGPKEGATCKVSTQGSSQFASALLLCAATGKWRINIPAEDTENAPYVAMTQAMVDRFPKSGNHDYQIEPDASGGSYFWAIRYLMSALNANSVEHISIHNWPKTDWQIDTRFPDYWPLPETVSRKTDLGDSIMTSIVMAPWSSQPVRFTDLARLRVQECERVAALRTELTKCGARVEESGETLTIYPGPLHGAQIDTYNDHRMAMCFAVVGSFVPDIIINNPSCVKKTLPNFFQKLASPAPDGLGMKIHDAATGNLLNPDSLIPNP
jgi:3-phosphoshikimate 1-carboxyvinyltransferase